MRQNPASKNEKQQQNTVHAQQVASEYSTPIA